MNRYFTICKSETREMQVSCNRVGTLEDYTGSLQERLNDLVDDHLNYVNYWAGTLDFSYGFNDLSETSNLDEFILVQLNDKGNYTRVN